MEISDQTARLSIYAHIPRARGAKNKEAETNGFEEKDQHE